MNTEKSTSIKFFKDYVNLEFYIRTLRALSNQLNKEQVLSVVLL